MVYDYSVLATKAVTLVEKYGRSVVLVKYSKDITDPNKPWRGGMTSTEVSTSGISVQPSSASQLGIMTVTENLAKRVDSIFLVAAGTVDLSKYDEIKDGNTTWHIEISEMLRPGNTTLLYFFGVKR